MSKKGQENHGHMGSVAQTGKNRRTWFWSLRHNTQSLSCQETSSTICTAAASASTFLKEEKKQRRPPAPVRLLDQDVIDIDSSSNEDNASSVFEEQVEKVSPTDLYLSLVLYFLNTGDVSTECC